MLQEKEEEEGLASIEYCVDASVRQLDDYIKKSKERQISAVGDSADNIKKNKTTIKTSKDIFSGPVAQRIEVFSLYGSWRALSDDSGFNSYPSRPEVYLVKNVVRMTTTMEGSNYWGYGYKTQHSYPRSWLIT